MRKKKKTKYEQIKTDNQIRINQNINIMLYVYFIELNINPWVPCINTKCIKSKFRDFKHAWTIMAIADMVFESISEIL